MGLSMPTANRDRSFKSFKELIHNLIDEKIHLLKHSQVRCQTDLVKVYQTFKKSLNYYIENYGIFKSRNATSIVEATFEEPSFDIDSEESEVESSDDNFNFRMLKVTI